MTDDISIKTITCYHIGREFKSREELYKDLFQFSVTNGFHIRKESRNKFLCSQSKTTHSNKKLQGLTIKRKDSAIASNCPFCIVHTVSKNTSAVKIKHVVADHNHPTNVSNVLASRRKSGISGREAVTETTNLLAPILSTGQKVNCNLVRKIIQPHVCPTVVLDATRVINIVRGVKKNMKDNIYNGTIMDEKSLSIFDKFSSSEASADNCREVLDNLK